MPDRIVRDELLQSERWMDLPSDTHRLVYVSLVLMSDDYGNIEGGGRRLFRKLSTFTQLKNEADIAKTLSDLQDAGMVLRYEVESREFWHLTRFKNSRQYWVRKCPQSPYDGDVTNELKQRLRKKRVTRESNKSKSRLRGEGLEKNKGEKLPIVRDTLLIDPDGKEIGHDIHIEDF